MSDLFVTLPIRFNLLFNEEITRYKNVYYIHCVVDYSERI